MENVYKTFDFSDFTVEISIRDPDNLDKYFWDDKVRAKAEQTLIDLVEDRWVRYTVEEWEAAFYGPKIDIKVKDAIGRDWQLTTVQLDFIQPENFNMIYTNEKWEEERPAVLHVAILWSSHRFMGVLIEHYAWAFPLWLAPTQVQIVPVANKFITYASSVAQKLEDQNIRTHIDDSDDSFSKKIRNSELMKVPYTVIVGEKEETDNTVSIRIFKTKEQDTLSLEKFVEQVSKECNERK